MVMTIREKFADLRFEVSKYKDNHTALSFIKNYENDMIWIAIVLIWNPVNYTIDKEFTSEIACWNYYEGGVGESKFGTQVLDHQGNKPGKEYHKKHRPPHREYPTRLYKGVDGWTRGLIWLTCDIKQQ